MSKLHVIKLEKGQDVKEGLKQYMMDKVGRAPSLYGGRFPQGSYAV